MSKARNNIPRFPFRFLRWFCPPGLLEEIEGDLLQRYERDLGYKSSNRLPNAQASAQRADDNRRRANRRLFWNTLRFFRPEIIFRNKFSLNFKHLPMISNYFKIAYRHLMHSKVFSFINVLGLAVGITAFFLIIQYVSFEMSYDRFHTNSENIYRVALKRYKNEVFQTASSENFAGLRKLLRENFPEVEAATGFYKTPANTGVFFKYKGQIYNELGGELNADSSFFKVFSSLLIKGDATTALLDPHSMVLSESMARKIFGEEEPLGQHVQMPNDGGRESDCLITGIIKDFPANSHLHANFVVPLTYDWSQQTEWSQDFMHTYISLKEGADPKQFSDHLDRVYRKLETQSPDVKGTKNFLQPIASIHLTSQMPDEMEVNGSQNLVYIAFAIGLIILIIAWINYVNLETARFAARAREVSVRRIIGSAKSDLALQFLIEYFCVLFVAIGLAALLIAFLIPQFSYLTGIPIASLQWSESFVWLIALAILAGGSVLVGVYPALFLLRLNPVAALKGNFGGTSRGRTVRRSLIVVQFCSSLTLIACVAVMNQQLDFMRTTDKKFDANHVITLRNPTAYSSEEVAEKHTAYRTLENKLMENASVQMVASSSAIPGTEIGFTYVNLLKRNVNDPYDPTHFKTLFIDYNYIPFYGLKLLAGRNFDPPRPIQNWVNPWDEENWLTLILNESAIRALGFNSPEEAVDQIVEFENFQDHFQKHKIIGVVQDYYHEAVKKGILPMILSPNYGSFQQVYYSIRLNPASDPAQAVNDVRKSWKAAFPDKPFEYSFLDRYYDQQFKSELYTKRIFSVFAGIAVFIGCLGILGMTLFEANARIKEISIRKVLGASATSLIALLSRDNFRLVLIAAVISMPLIYYIANEWLSTYPIRIGVSPLFFLAPLGIILLVVAGTSSFQTLKAANTNPVDHLKNE
jgi:putative ABC transport system permease protein